jgi:hypothetical protein
MHSNAPSYLAHSTIFLSFVLLTAVTACEPTTSSSTHWLQCQKVSDCAPANAADCRDGYCIDMSGNRMRSDATSLGGSAGSIGNGGNAAVAAGGRTAASNGGQATSSNDTANAGVGQGGFVSAGGGSSLGGTATTIAVGGSVAIHVGGVTSVATGGSSTASTATGGRAGSSAAAGGTVQTGGATGGTVTSGASNQGGSSGLAGTGNRGGTTATAGANNAGAAGACLTTVFLNSLKECNADTDCEKVRYMVNCCGTYVWVSVRADKTSDLSQCLATRPQFPACGCASMGDTVEDGRHVTYNGEDVVARCVNHQCQSRAAARTCGITNPVACSEGQLCVSYETTVGPSSTVEYACATNPCTDQVSCSCAQSVCSLRTDVTRTCYAPASVGATNIVDVGCQDNRQ